MPMLEKENSYSGDYDIAFSDTKTGSRADAPDTAVTESGHNRCLHELIDDVARRLPDTIAAIFEDTQITYGELEKRTNQLANYLQKLGVTPDTLVGLCLERSLEMLIGTIAIQKAGGAYVPLDPTFPPNRLELVLEDAEAKILLTEEKQRQLLNKGSARRVLIDSDWPEIAKEKTTAPESGVLPNHLAYVMYTSGSTGKPKGVQIEHRSVVNFLHSMRKTPGFTRHDTLLAVTTLAFDISVLELYLPLTTGARVVIVSNDKIADGPALIRTIEEHHITVMQATPATWRLMLESGWKNAPDLKILCGGEPMPADMARELIPKCKELWNMYGPTETTIWSTCARITDPNAITIGTPIDNTDILILDDSLKVQPDGTEGELTIGGDGLARGYINLPEMTAKKFIPHPLKEGQRIYRTGDVAKIFEDGSIVCLGRMDDQIKLRGFRIELGDIETHLSEIGGIYRAVVMLREDRPGHKRLVAYYTGDTEQAQDILRDYLLNKLPEYMVPSVFVHIDQFPLTPNGKTDRKALPAPQQKRPLLANDYIAPRTELEKKLAVCWETVLEIEGIGINDSFFDLGGTSLLAAKMVGLWHKDNEYDIPLVKLFQYHTIALLNSWMLQKNKDDDIIQTSERRIARLKNANRHQAVQTPVAIVGMAGRFPGADNLESLWQNFCNGVESIRTFAREELGIGIDESLRFDPDYIPSRGIIDGAEYFDAPFFGISPLEASVMDPQQRVFLELAYEALENAGYDPDRPPGPVGVYAGIGDNHYYSINLLSNPDIIKQAGNLVVEYGNEKDYIALRVAYFLGLTGPALSANTACSTSLVAVDNAVQGLSSYDCDMALAGGIDISVPQKSGFPYVDGGVFAKDGHCKPFDEDATGTMFCDGAGLVVLKRLDDAIADGDTIYAVIRGSAKNSNGSRPASFLAPSVDGQAEVVALAQARAGIPVETIGYIEAHGTGTPIGDPIEVDALSRVFGAKTQKKQFCYIGSLKGNIGHPTNAAGIAGLIKAALVLHKEQIPPLLHFKTPNAKIDFNNSPFKVADSLIEFPRSKIPRRTAVSSFGFGGTNAHAILDEAPLPGKSGPSRSMQLVTLSAKTSSALKAYAKRLADYFDTANDDNFADAAYTLIKGRKQLPHRKIVVASAPEDASALLKKPNPTRTVTRICTKENPPVVFLFGGQGTQSIDMALSLYRDEPLFRAIVDECCEYLRPYLDQDLKDILYPSAHSRTTAGEALQNTRFTQPAVFTIEYALATWWQSLGIEPAMMAGHSIGEFVAATVAGVFDLPDALKVAALRGKLMQSMPEGSMLSVRDDADEIAGLLPSQLQMAAVNAPSLCVVSGPDADIENFRADLESRDIVSRVLHTSHAFHSAMMDPILDPLRDLLSGIKLNSPRKPFISTVTGLPITEDQATAPEYWVMHARKTVRFSSAVSWLTDKGFDLFLECGPRATMSTLVRQHMTPEKPVTAIPSMGNSEEDASGWGALLMAVGSLWLEGVNLDWDAFYTHEQRHRIPLPTYPFERNRYWVEPVPKESVHPSSTTVVPLKPVLTAIPSAPEHSDADPAARAPDTSTASRKDRLRARLIDILAPVWGQDVSMISDTATFLEQGFDSLALTQIANGIRNKFGLKISFSQLMKEYPNMDLLIAYLEENVTEEDPAETELVPAPVSNMAAVGQQTAATDPSAHQADIFRLENKIEKLATQISKLTAMLSETAAADPETNRLPAGKPLETTVPQRGIFFSSRLSDSLSATYNESVTITIYGKIDSHKLKSAVNRLVNRHDALRASFDETGEIMRIAPLMILTVDERDFRQFDSNTQKEKLQRLLAEETAQPFSLPDGPLFRSKILILSDDTAAVIMTGHHTICDGWSLDVLIQDFCSFYSEEISGEKHALKEAPSYADFVRMAAQRNFDETFAEARTFWEERFSEGFHALVLPADRPRTGQRKFTAKRKEIRFDSDKTESLRSAAAKQGVSFFAFVLGAYVMSLARISGQNDFIIALPTAEQPVLGQPDLVGHCVNMVPFQVRLAPNISVTDFVATVQEALITSHHHAAYTLTHLLRRLRPANRIPGITPISAGITSVRKYLPSELTQDGFKVEYDINAKSFESFEWYITALEDGNEFILRGNYDTGLFDGSTVDGWLNDFRTILMNISTNPSQTVVDVTGLDARNSTQSFKTLFLLADEKPSSPVSGHLIGTDAGKQDTFTGSSPKTAAELESRLIQIWESVLGTRGIEVTDNFFDIGGNSMAAAQIFAHMDKGLSIRLPLSVLFEFPTPRELASRILNRPADDQWHSLVAINSQGTRRPIFLIHGAEGNILIYRALALHLEKDQPVYGLQARGVDGGDMGEVDFETVARRYIDEIRVVQPHGPYNLGGYCLGGTIAMEMAHQLQAMGEPVGWIFMFENYNIQAMQWPLPRSKRFLNKALNGYYHFFNLIAARGSRFSFFKEKLKIEILRAVISIRHIWARSQRRSGDTSEHLHHLKVGEAYDQALERYTIKPYSGRVALFLSKKSLVGFPTEKGGWAGLIDDGPEVHTLDMYPRGSMTEPYVGDLAQRIRSLLGEESL